MKNKKRGGALQAPAETRRGKDVEKRRLKHDADTGNDGSTNERLQKEIRIDPGTEHHHRTDADDTIFDEDIDRSPRYEADAGGDGTGTVGPEPGE